jgi:hypothetical protein
LSTGGLSTGGLSTAAARSVDLFVRIGGSQHRRGGVSTAIALAFSRLTMIFLWRAGEHDRPVHRDVALLEQHLACHPRVELLRRALTEAWRLLSTMSETSAPRGVLSNMPSEVFFDAGAISPVRLLRST